MTSESAFLGISLGRPYYTTERLTAYCAWAKAATERFAFLIGDDLFQFNLRAFKGLAPDEALRRARRKGDDIERQLRRVLAAENYHADIVRWRALPEAPRYTAILNECMRLFRADPTFEVAVRDQVFENIGAKAEQSQFPMQAESGGILGEPTPLHMYIIHEIAGLSVMCEDLKYHLKVYPGPELKIIDQIYANQWPSLRSLLPTVTYRGFLRLELES